MKTIALGDVGTMQVFVLMFNVGTANEGLHTIQIAEHNVILMFAAEDDATRYALLLEAQDFATPDVVAIDQTEIEEFCEASGYHAQFVPAGFVPQSDAERLLLVPPEQNVTETDWQVDAEPTPESVSRVNEDDDQLSASEMANDELDRIRRQLEGLL